MRINPQEISIDIIPESRFAIIDIKNLAIEKLTSAIDLYRKAAYCSFHTTAGFLEQSLCARLQFRKDHIESYIAAFKRLFPKNADYRHDVMDMRRELSQQERLNEPKNADSHLTFIGSGLKNYVTYANKAEIPVYFIELDGIHEFGRRNRHTSVMYYNHEEVVYQQSVDVPVSQHPIDSINLRDSRLGYLEKINQLLNYYEIENGRIDISLDHAERNAGITVNEYETLLMTHDLVEILRNPLKFMGEKGKYIIQNPQRIPSRTREYAKYDLVHILNEMMDAFHISQSLFEKIVAKFMAMPAERLLRFKRSISMLISNNHDKASTNIVQGRYQSPILIQWKQAANQTRRLNLKITRFK
jgi:thiamine phosphate synthase YjbQ (UPF0047 family)